MADVPVISAASIAPAVPPAASPELPIAVVNASRATGRRGDRRGYRGVSTAWVMPPRSPHGYPAVQHLFEHDSPLGVVKPH